MPKPSEKSGGMPSAECTLAVDSTQRFVEIEDVHVTETGAFAVLEGAPSCVVLLDGTGEKLRSSVEGRLGDVLSRVLEDADGRLLVPDVRHDRVDLYHTHTLELVGSVPLGLDHGLALGWATDRRGGLYHLVPESPLLNLLAAFRRPKVLLRVVEGGSVRNLFSLPGAVGDGAVYGPRFVWCVCGDGTIAATAGVDAKLDYFTDADAEAMRSVPAPDVGPPITTTDREVIASVLEAEAERIADDVSPFAAALIRSEAKPEAIADVYPAFVQILCDDRDRIWFRLPAHADELREQSPRVAFHMVDNGSSRWLVQDSAGTRLWGVSFPAGFTLTRFRNDLAVGFMRAMDHARVQAYRITPPAPVG